MKKIKNWMGARLREPSTYAGAAAVAVALDSMNVIHDGAAVADVLANVGAAVASGNAWGALLAAAFGVLAIVKREKSAEAARRPGALPYPSDK